MKKLLALGSTFALVLAACGSASAATKTFTTTLTKTDACTLANVGGSATITFDDQTGVFTGTVTLQGVTPITAAHIHSGAGANGTGNGPVVTDFSAQVTAANGANAISGTLDATARTAVTGVDAYVQVHSSAAGCGGGAVRGHLKEAVAPVDAGTDATVADAASDASTSSSSSSSGSSGTSTSGGSSGASSSGSSGTSTSGGSSGATSSGSSGSAEPADDGGCSTTGAGLGGSAAFAAGLFGLAALVGARRRSRR